MADLDLEWELHKIAPMYNIETPLFRKKIPNPTSFKTNPTWKMLELETNYFSLSVAINWSKFWKKQESVNSISLFHLCAISYASKKLCLYFSQELGIWILVFF